MSGPVTIGLPTRAMESTVNTPVNQLIAARVISRPSGDPLRWNSKDVLSWLDYVFQTEHLRLSDLTFYLRWHVAQYDEKLTGEDLSRLNFANYLDRWGYSGPVLFERFLQLLQQHGYAGGNDLLSVWKKVQTVTHDDLSVLLQSGYLAKPTSDAEKERTAANAGEKLHVEGNLACAAERAAEAPPPVLMMEPTPQLEVIAQEFEQLELPEVNSPSNFSGKSFGPSGSSEGTTDIDSDYDSFQSSDKADSPCSSSGSENAQVKRRKTRVSIPKLPTFPGNTALTLWEFLLELLADSTYASIIRWDNKKAGTFMIKDSEVTAALWGLHRHKDGMNYDKMSRALRYYYKKKLLKKVPGSRLTYKFMRETHWLNYKVQADGYDTTHVGDQQLACLGRLSRRGQRQDVPSRAACQAETHAMADAFTWSSDTLAVTT